MLLLTLQAQHQGCHKEHGKASAKTVRIGTTDVCDIGASGSATVDHKSLAAVSGSVSRVPSASYQYMPNLSGPSEQPRHVIFMPGILFLKSEVDIRLRLKENEPELTKH